MRDSILWDDESDRYTDRAKATHRDIFENYDTVAVEKCTELINGLERSPQTILDIGCAYGVFLYQLAKRLSGPQFYGIDPGKETIKLATNVGSNLNIKFQNGYSHDLPFRDGSIDFIILNMVLQWIPRNYLLKSLAEIDRVLGTDGHIFIQEFDPPIPKYSESSHNKDVLIFKDQYEDCFTAFPWFDLVFKQCLNVEKGGDFRKSLLLIRKTRLDEAYALKAWS